MYILKPKELQSRQTSWGQNHTDLTQNQLNDADLIGSKKVTKHGFRQIEMMSLPILLI